MGFYRPKTKRGYDLFEVASCLQKAIRRANPTLAGYMAIELFESGFAGYCWKRLLTISAEDCAGILTQEIKALHESFVLLNQGAKKPRSRIFLSKMCIRDRDDDRLGDEDAGPGFLRPLVQQHEALVQRFDLLRDDSGAVLGADRQQALPAVGGKAALEQLNGHVAGQGGVPAPDRLLEAGRHVEEVIAALGLGSEVAHVRFRRF